MNAIFLILHVHVYHLCLNVMFDKKKLPVCLEQAKT